MSTMIHNFYNSINSKTIADEELAKFISKECKFEDMAFQKPFVGEKEVNDFLRELKKAMGKQIKFKVDKVFGGNDLDVGVLWHLEWNENVIPFTKGCSLFECSRAGENILIKY
ncbi:hypothetical protein J5N97_016404 [Dioscorea zingiberensis]|uniref:Nuclear transport factor 2 domain-containing protein n=1 Tax=Dioscorea zingiberensis TaxID=325984 RepID=A0A9D5CK89_9LILI|nr:hypothetical protein J5N97_016404 [Dioscorea zingiberensis]